ncbi:Uncharacterised protein [Raoultella planticola]|nr:Uncharacterised protein [Raoultella planticola]
MSSMPVAEKPLSQPSGLVFTARLLAAIVIFAAVAPGILMTAPAVAAQLASEWQLTPAEIGYLFSAETRRHEPGDAAGMVVDESSELAPRGPVRLRGISRRQSCFGGGQSVRNAADRPLHRLAGGGTLMILCISCAAGTANPSRVYAFWVLGQLLLGMVGLLVLPALFASFGLKVVYLILAAIMLCCLPLVPAFPQRFQPMSASRLRPSVAPLRKLLAVLAVLTFYISLSAVWTFIGTIGSAAGLTAAQIGMVLAAATVFGIIGAGGAALRGTRRPDRIAVWLGYGLLILSIVLLVSHPLLVRFALAALLFKFTWTFVLPFILARVAGLDNNGRLMNSINLVIGGGMAAGPALAGALLQRFSSADALLAAAGGCALISAGLILAASSAGKSEPTGG